MKKSKSKIYKMLRGVNRLKWNVAGKGILIGCVSGMLAVLYRLGIEYGTGIAGNIYKIFNVHPIYIIPWIAVAIAAGFFVAWLDRFEPMAAGSGIPQVEGVALYGLKMRWGMILAVRFVAGILCSFFGLSLGREGPSIQIGAAGGQAVSEKISDNSIEKDCLITGGAAAGLSAAFSAPLSGMMFALEEVHRSFSPIILLSVATASLTADFISKYFFGLKPVLDFTAIPQLPIYLYLWLIPLGIVTGLVGSLMNKSLLAFQTLYSRLPDLSRPVIAFLIALPCGMLLPITLGGGQNLIKFAENAQSGVLMLVILLAAKMLFTSTSFGSGVPGGIFMPILAVGTLTGSIFGILATRAGLPARYIPVFVVCAMAGGLAASVKSPVTSILLTAEMSGSLVHMLPVAACAFIALLVSDILNVDPIYEALLGRFVGQNEDKLPVRERGGLMEVPVELGSMAADRRISDIEWPEGSLVVGVNRGTKEVVPSGSTMIRPGDYLVILSSNQKETGIRNRIYSICHTKV